MEKFARFLKKHKRGFQCAFVCALAFCVFAAVWFTHIRGQGDKSLSWAINDQFHEFVPVEDKVHQEFFCGRDLLALSVVVAPVDPEHPPKGELELVLSDTDTGEELARSTGEMRYILNGKDGYYTTLGLDRMVEMAYSTDEARYALTLIPHYEDEGRFAIGYEPGDLSQSISLSVDGEPITGMLALVGVQDRVGGFLTRFYWMIAFGAIALAGGSFWLFTSKKAQLHHLVFCLVLVLGILYGLVLPPYAAPDERFHINQSLSFASTIYDDHLPFAHTNMHESLLRPSDHNALVQVDETTVFTWKALARWLPEGNHDEWGKTLPFDEPQVSSTYTMYAVSGFVVYLGYLLRLGFVQLLYLGRFANLLVFAFFTAFAVKKTPVAKPVFAIVSLLPMTLHLAVSFSRDSNLLACSFLFAALVLDAAFGPREKLTLRQLVPITLLGMVIPPEKLVYLPILALIYLIPRSRLGEHPHMIRAGILSICIGVFLMNSTATTTISSIANDDIRPPSSILDGEEEKLDEEELEQLYADMVCFTPSYILSHPVQTFELCVRTVVEKGEHYVRTLVGGTLGYFNLKRELVISTTWVIFVYLLMALAWLCPNGRPLSAKASAICLLAGLACCGLAVVGNVVWTPTYYTTIYGLQGRYFLPVLPLLLLARPKALTLHTDCSRGLVWTMGLVDLCVLLNAFLGVVAR